jgi:hypothetical protein
VSDAILRLKIVLADTEPPIWRRVEVPAEMTLKELHGVIQAAMGWDDDHLFQFYVGRETIAGPGMGGEGFGARRSIGAGRVRLEDLAARGVKRFTHLYDMGDSWEHKIQVEKTLPADPAASYRGSLTAPCVVRPKTSAAFPGSTSSSTRSTTPSIPTMRIGSIGMARCSIPTSSTPIASARPSIESRRAVSAPSRSARRELHRRLHRAVTFTERLRCLRNPCRTLTAGPKTKMPAKLFGLAGIFAGCGDPKPPRLSYKNQCLNIRKLRLGPIDRTMPGHLIKPEI